MRSEKVDDVVKKLEYIIAKAKEKGWKSTWREEEEEIPRPARKCEKCGKETVYRTGTSKGRKWAGWFCTNKECGEVEWVNLKT